MVFLKVRTARPFPEKTLVDLARANQILELFETRESTVFEGLEREINLLEKLVELLHAFVRVPITLELRQMPVDFVKVNAVTPVV